METPREFHSLAPEAGLVVAALAVLVLSWRAKDEGRLLLMIVFSLGGLSSIYCGFMNPEEYISSTQLAYGSWDLRVFLAHAIRLHRSRAHANKQSGERG